jgi:deazaflavin-dependent oxidoreductase (nitroreductase family)
MADFSEIPWIAEHIELYKTDPEKAHHWDSTPLGGPGILPTLLLTTKGRKSGNPLIYGKFDEAYVIIASKGGMPTHPVWFLNLEADPECDIQVASEKMRVRARIAEGEEREKIWKAMAKIYPPYDEYQKNAAGRVIPVVVLDPIG